MSEIGNSIKKDRKYWKEPKEILRWKVQLLKRIIHYMDSKAYLNIEKMRKLEDSTIEIVMWGTERKGFKKIEQSLTDLLNNTKINIRSLGVPEERERKKRVKRTLLKIQWLKTQIWYKLWIYKSKTIVPNRINSERSTPRYITTKLSTAKKRVLFIHPSKWFNNLCPFFY